MPSSFGYLSWYDLKEDKRHFLFINRSLNNLIYLVEHHEFIFGERINPSQKCKILQQLQHYRRVFHLFVFCQHKGPDHFDVSLGIDRLRLQKNPCFSISLLLSRVDQVLKPNQILGIELSPFVEISMVSKHEEQVSEVIYVFVCDLEKFQVKGSLNIVEK